MVINKNIFIKKIAITVTSIAALSLLISCSGKRDSPGSTQVAAKVGKYEVTNFELNNALARVPNIPPEQLANARAAALESIVREQLLIQQAQADKLDRQPQIVAAIEQARREILARAYASQITDAQLKPSEEDVHQYYQQHPELFASRRIYSVKEITTPASPETSAYLRDFSSSGKTLEQFGQWLQDKKVPFHANSGSREPESLPLNLLPQLVNTKDGGTIVFNNGPVFYVAQILASRPAPIAEDKAAPNIRRYLTAQRSKAALNREIARLKANTKIEYEGEFSKTQPKTELETEQVPSLTDQSSSTPSNASVSWPD